MTKWLNAFLEFKNEAEATRKFALAAVVIITLGLASLSVTGIIATATWTWLSALPTLGLILAVLGAEALATVAFIRTLTASTKARKIAGALIFLGLAAIGVHNAENGAHVVWPDRFAVSSGKLSAQAELAGEEAATLQKAQDAAVGGTGTELERVRTQIAELKTEQQIMASMSPEGISKAQSLLLAQGLYFGSVDGIRQDKTESAMRARGEAITRELATLKAREDGLMQGQASPVLQANTSKRLEQIDNADKAAAAFWAWFWLILMLCTLEGARSLSLWALITDMTGRDANRDRERQAELDELRHQNERAALIAQRTAAPEPVAAPVEAPPAPVAEPVAEPIAAAAPEPEPAPLELTTPLPPPEPELTDQQRRSRAGGLEAQQQRRAAKTEKLLTVGDWEARDADAQAARMAAQ